MEKQQIAPIAPIALSIVDIEKKYAQDYEEAVYGANSIVSYGADNNFPVLLRNCYRSSATLKSVIDGIVAYILGDGIEVGDELALFQEKVNRTGMTMRQFIANLAIDYMVYGGFAYQVINTKLGTIAELYPLDFCRCRTNEWGTKIFYSKKNWTKWGTKAEEFERYDKSKLQNTAIVYFKGDFTKNVYPLPMWYGALNDVLTEIECSRYSLNSVSSGFSAKYLINFPNTAQNLTDEQKQAIEDGIKTKFCGTDTSSNFMLWFADGTDGLSVEKLETDDSSERFIAIKDNCRQNIYTSLRCTPLLFGLPNVTNGFSTSEYKDSYKLFQKSVIAPIQDVLIESISKTLGVEGAITILPFNITFDE